jgi:hypothetical protein
MMTSDWSPIEAGHQRGPWDEMSWKFEGWYTKRKPAARAGVRASEFFWSWREQTTAALLELFGILEIPRAAPKEGENWRIVAVRLAPFGAAFLDHFRDLQAIDCLVDRFSGESAEDGKWLGDFFHDCYPNCLNTFPEASEEFVEGVWQFKVSLGPVWRRIVIPADSNVEELAGGILDAYRFDYDHLYELMLRDRSGRSLTIAHPCIEDAKHWTDEFAIGSLPLDPGQSMTFLYDFGDQWQFTVKLEKILPPNHKMTRMKVIEKKGKAPKQYPDYDW